MDSYILNPYKSSVPFLGHMQTVQTKNRRRRTGITIRNRIKMKKYTRHPGNSHPGNGQLVRRRSTIENQFDLSRWTSSPVFTCINKHPADMVTTFNVSLHFYFSFGCKSQGCPSVAFSQTFGNRISKNANF